METGRATPRTGRPGRWNLDLFAEDKAFYGIITAPREGGPGVIGYVEVLVVFISYPNYRVQVGSSPVVEEAAGVVFAGGPRVHVPSLDSYDDDSF